MQMHSGTPRRWLALFAAVLTSIPLFCSQAAAARRSKSDRDISAIGRRNIAHGDERKFISAPQKEKQLGAQFFSAFQRSAKLITDSEINKYLSDLAQKIGRNSDSTMPVTVIVVDNNTVNACTSPGGYQYITRGLLAHAKSEGELAAVLAHGIAEAALRLPMRQQLRQSLLSLAAPTVLALWPAVPYPPMNLMQITSLCSISIKVATTLSTIFTSSNGFGLHDPDQRTLRFADSLRRLNA